MEDAGTTFCVENFRQAKECDDAELWDESMLEELSACIENGTWVTVAMTTLPQKPNIMKTKWIYKIKPAADGTVLRRKSRVVVDGSRQRYDQYDDTYSPVAHARLFGCSSLQLSCQGAYFCAPWTLKLRACTDAFQTEPKSMSGRRLDMISEMDTAFCFYVRSMDFVTHLVSGSRR